MTNHVNFVFNGREINWKAIANITFPSIQTISVLQLKKILRKNKGVAHLIHIKKMSEDIKDEHKNTKMEKILQEYKDVFADKIPDELPPKEVLTIKLN